VESMKKTVKFKNNKTGYVGTVCDLPAEYVDAYIERMNSQASREVQAKLNVDNTYWAE
jgi:hypothetical protein